MRRHSKKNCLPWSFPTMTCTLIPPKSFKQNFDSDDEQEVKAFNEMLADPRWINARTFRNQSQILIEYMHNENVNVSFSKLGLLFGNRHCVQKQYYKIAKAELIRSPGRPKLLAPSQHAELERVIKSWHLRSIFPTYDEICDFIFERFSISIDIESCRKYIDNNFSFEKALGIPLDQNRLNCSELSIDEYYDQLEIDIAKVNPSFIYNLDEVGFQDHADAKIVTVVVPENCPSQKVNLPTDRNDRRCSALVCISMDGENVTPTLILPRSTIDSEVYSILPKNCFKAFHQKNGFITTAIFLKWWYNVFIPHLQLKRQKYNYYGPALVILDGLLQHHLVLDDVNEVRNNIIIRFIPPHSSDQVQMLDLGVFGYQKRISKFKVKPPSECSAQSKKIIKMVTGIYRSTDPLTTASSFRQAGIIYEYSKNGIQTAKVFRGCARGVRHYSPERLSIVENLTQSQQNAQNTRLEWKKIHDNSFRINI